MMKFVFGALALWSAAYFTGRVLLKSKDINYISTFLAIILCSIILIFLNYEKFEEFTGIIKIITVYLSQIIFYKIVFKENLSKSIIVALIWYLCLIFSEAIVVFITSIILNILGISLNILKDNLIMNIIISIFNFTLIYLLKEKLRLLIENNKFNEKSTLIIIIVMLIMISMIGFKRPISEWYFDKELIFTLIVLLCFCIIGLYLIKQKYEIEKTTSMYQHVVEYSDTTNKVLEDYRMIGHEHKNQLSIIRQMVHKDNVELIEYLDSLLAKRNGIKYKWVSELNKLPLEGLKGLINYKLIEAEENKVNISVIISKDVSKVKLNKLSTSEKDHLYSIGGVYLDNAIQAASKSKTKEINIEIYKENKELVFILANTFSGNIELNKLDNYGYSTKGKNHGVGLHIVKSIIDDDKLFSQSRKVIDNFYIQELRINISKLYKKKK